MFCNQCGTEIPENAKFCNKCGCAVNAEGKEERIIHASENTKAEPDKTATAKEPPYMKYCDKVRKINKLTLIVQILSVVVGLAMLFLPIYQYTYEASLDDIESWEQLGNVIENEGYITKNFSIADDVGRIVKMFTENDDVGVTTGMLALVMSLFLVVFIIVLIDVVCRTIVNLIKTYTNREDISRSAMLKYDEIKLEMGLSEKEKAYNMARRQSQNSIPYALVMALTDVIFCKFVSPLFIGDVSMVTVRYMQDLTGVSFYMFILIAILVGFFVVDSMIKKEEKEMLASITEEKYQMEQ